MFILGDITILHTASLVWIRPTSYQKILLCNLHLVNHQIFLIFAFLVVLYMFQLLNLSTLRWDLNVDLGFILVLILPLLLDTLSLY
jgi:hypothetical protein